MYVYTSQNGTPIESRICRHECCAGLIIQDEVSELVQTAFSGRRTLVVANIQTYHTESMHFPSADLHRPSHSVLNSSSTIVCGLQVDGSNGSPDWAERGGGVHGRHQLLLHVAWSLLRFDHAPQSLKTQVTFVRISPLNRKIETRCLQTCGNVLLSKAPLGIQGTGLQLKPMCVSASFHAG